MKIEEKFVETQYGRLYYLEAGEGEKDFYFFHGYWGDPEGIKYFAPNICPLGYRVLDFYLPGHGKSFSLPRKTTYKEINNQLARAVKAISNEKPVVIMGESMGGGMAIEVVNNLKDQIVGLILCNPLLTGGPLLKLPRIVAGLIADFFSDHSRKIFKKYKPGILKINIPKVKKNNLLKAVFNLPLITNFEINFSNLPAKTLLLKGKSDHTVPNILIDAKAIYFSGGHYWFVHQYEALYTQITDFLKKL